MALILVTGVPGTGKTAFIVSEIEKIVATGRKVFVDNIPDLKLEHYRAGKIPEWQKGTWLHIDQYKRTGSAITLQGKPDDDDGDGNENWEPNPEVVKDKDGNLHRIAFDASGNVVGSVPYESHKGAAIFIDEAQRHFRPRPSGSVVPDHVAALEVHRHQGLDIYLITQRPGLVDSNVRALCGKHIALRATALGRYKYEWPEVGDIESKTSRDTAAKSRYKLPKHVFSLYKSAEAHTKHKHTLPMAAKALLVLLPLAAFLMFSSYKTISAKFNPVQPVQAEQIKPQPRAVQSVQQASFDLPASAVFASGLIPFSASEIDNHHPFERNQFSIVARMSSATKDVFRFSASENGMHSFYISSVQLEQAGYAVLPITDCSAKLVYKGMEFFVTCDVSRSPPDQQQYVAHQGIQFQ